MSVNGISSTTPPDYYGPNGLLAQTIKANMNNWTGAAQVKKAEIERTNYLREMEERKAKNPDLSARQTAFGTSGASSVQKAEKNLYQNPLDALALISKLRAEKAERESSLPGPGSANIPGQDAKPVL